MRMQNADMEFVTFDAHDVIATSGGPKGLLMQVGVAAAYNNDQKDKNYWLNSYSGKKITDSSDPSRWITFNPVGYDPDGKILNATSASKEKQTTDGVDYDEYTKYSETVFESIVAWLKQQGIQ